MLDKSCSRVLLKVRFFFANAGKIRDRSLILPGEGVEDIWEVVPKFCTLRSRAMKHKEHFKRKTGEILEWVSAEILEWGSQNIYINLRGGRKFHQIYENVFHPLPTSK